LKGEIEGIDLTLNFLNSKREEALRLGRRQVVDIGTPKRRRDKG
jgi:hypothetical protein